MWPMPWSSTFKYEKFYGHIIQLTANLETFLFKLYQQFVVNYTVTTKNNFPIFPFWHLLWFPVSGNGNYIYRKLWGMLSIKYLHKVYISFTLFNISTASRLAPDPSQPPIQWVTRAFSLGTKQLGHEAGHSPPSSTKVKNGGAICPLPHMSSWHDS
jgi:hypothetical protein